MTYFTGNTVSASNLINFRGPIGPNLPYPNNTTAESGAIAALIGYGYGTRGYGQLNTFLPATDYGKNVSSIEWNAMQAAMSNINIHTGIGLTMQPRVTVQGQVIAEDGVSSTANIELLTTLLDTGRLQHAYSQMETSNVLTSTRTESWTGTISHEFTVDFTDEDRARWYFNSGGAVELSAKRFGGTETATITITEPFTSPAVYPVTFSGWSSFMNSHAMWVESSPEEKPDRSNQLFVYYRNFNAPYTETYKFNLQADNQLILYLDGVHVYTTTSFSGIPDTVDLKLSAGNHVLRFEILNYPPSRGDNDWDNNPAGWALTITSSSTSAVVWDTRLHGSAELISNTTFTSPEVYAVSSSDWSGWMNNNAVWTSSVSTSFVNILQTRHRNLVIPYKGDYTFTYASDDTIKIYINDTQIIIDGVTTSRYNNQPGKKIVNLSAGTYVMRTDTYSSPAPSGWGIVINDSNGNIIWKTRSHLAAETVPGPLGPSVVISTDGSTNGQVSNLLVDAGTITLDADTVSTSGLGDVTPDAGYYNLPSSYTRIYTTYNDTGPQSNLMILGNVYASPSVTYTYTVPQDTIELMFKVWGAGGGGGMMFNDCVAKNGGAGAYVQAKVPVTPGEQLTVYIGGGGNKGFSIGNNWEDTYGAGGGGWSGIFRKTSPLIIVAGGGGAPASGVINQLGAIAWASQDHLPAETIPGNPSFVSPGLYAKTWPSWSTFMNAHAVWPDPGNSHPATVTKTWYRNFTATATGNYLVQMAADNAIYVYIDEILIGSSNSYSGNPASYYIMLGAGAHILKFVCTNYDSNSPAGAAVVIYAPAFGGKGGAGGITSGRPGTLGNGNVNSSGGTQSSGGTGGIGDSSAWNGGAGKFLAGGWGGNHDIQGGVWVVNESYSKGLTGTVPGVNGGLNGGAQGGEQGSGGGGGGYYGGGGGGATDQSGTGSLYSPGGGAGGSSYISPLATNVVTAVSPDGFTAPNKLDNDYRQGIAIGGLGGVTKGDIGQVGGDGLVAVYRTTLITPQHSNNWFIDAKVESVNNAHGGNGSKIRFKSTITSNGNNRVNGTTLSNVKQRIAKGVLVIQEPVFSTISGLDAPAIEPVLVNPLATNNETMTCIAVIDEVSPSAASIQSSYNQFRLKWPGRYLYLLQPKTSATTLVTKLPTTWAATSYDFGPTVVNRDNGNADYRSDWYGIAALDRLPYGSTIALFIDSSGSMTVNSVQASYNYLKSRCTERNIKIIVVSNSSENWISPFISVAISN